MSVILWSYSVVLRTKTSAGAVVHTFTVGQSTVGGVFQGLTRVSVEWEILKKPRGPAVDESLFDLVVGWRGHLVLQWKQRNTGIKGLTGIAPVTDSLNVLLSDLVTAGNYLELSLNGAGGTYRRMELESDRIAYRKLGDVNVGLDVELALQESAIRTTLPDVLAASW